MPAYVAGVVDVHGRDTARHRPARAVRPADPDHHLTDHFVIATRRPTPSSCLWTRPLAPGEIPVHLIPPDTELPRCVRKVVPLDMGVVYSLDLQRVLFGDQPPFDSRLAQILAELQGRMTQDLSVPAALIADRMGLNFPQDRWPDLAHGLAKAAAESGLRRLHVPS